MARARIEAKRPVRRLLHNPGEEDDGRDGGNSSKSTCIVKEELAEFADRVMCKRNPK